MPVNPVVVGWRLRNACKCSGCLVNEQEETEQDMQIKQMASHGPRRPPAKDVTVTANRRPPLKRRDVRAGNG